MNAADSKRAVFIERRAARLVQNAEADPKTAPMGMRWIELARERCIDRRNLKVLDVELSYSLRAFLDQIAPYALKAQEEAGR